jgi:hypothetical protein
MRIGQALMAAACMVSGIVVFGAGAAGAQSYSGGGYQPSYSPTYQRSYSAGLQASGYQRPGYAQPVETTYDRDDGYRSAPGYDAQPVYASQSYAPGYEAPRYARPVYAPSYGRPVYVPPVDTCHDRGW